MLSLGSLEQLINIEVIVVTLVFWTNLYNVMWQAIERVRDFFAQ
jgi:hypothetical protein